MVSRPEQKFEEETPAIMYQRSITKEEMARVAETNSYHVPNGTKLSTLGPLAAMWDLPERVPVSAKKLVVFVASLAGAGFGAA